MSKLFKLIVSLILCSSFLCFSACKKQVDNNKVDDKNLKIMVLNRGYGVEWLNALAAAYETKYPDKNIEIEEALITTSISTSLQGGKEKNDTDLYFVVDNGQSAALVDSYASKDGGFLDLTTLYNTTIPGESVTFGDKMNTSIKNQFVIDNHYYTFPWASSSIGLFYNEAVLNNVLGQGNWSVPNTTDELFALGDRYKVSQPNKFLLYCSILETVTQSLFLSWWAQYEGFENYNRFWKGQYYNAIEDEVEGNSYKIFSQTGRLKAMQEMERLCRPSNGYAVENASAADDTTYTLYQTRFFTPSENYALYPCGDWLYSESGSGDNNVKMMKTPIISSIVEKLEYREGEAYMSDAMLSQVVDAIDAGTTSFANVSEKDFNRIKEARTIVSSNANLQLGFIPAYANAAELAKDFLLFMASNEGINVYKNNLTGGFSPFEYAYDTSKLNTFDKSVYNTIKGANFVQISAMHPLFYKAGVLSTRRSDVNMDVAFNVASSSRFYITAEQFYNYFIDQYDSASWNTVLKKL